MLSLKRVLCVCIFFVIGMEGAPKPKPKAEPKPQPPIGYPPYSGGYNLPGTNPGPWNWNGFPPTRDANPGPWNWNGFPPTRGANPWQLYWNGSPNLNRGQVVDKGGEYVMCQRKRGKTPRPAAPDGTKGCLWFNAFRQTRWGECQRTRCVQCKSQNHEDCRFKGDW